MSKDTAIWKREDLTLNEQRITQATLTLVVLYAIISTSIIIGTSMENANDPGYFTHLSTNLEFLQHNSSLFATLAGFLVTDAYINLVIRNVAKNIDPAVLQERKDQLIPLISAVLIAIFHWYAESGVGGKGMGTPDARDALYGILSIFPAYIVWRSIRK